MGVADTPKYIGAYWTHRERKEPGSSNQKCFDYHALYVGYNVTTVFLRKSAGGAHLQVILRGEAPIRGGRSFTNLLLWGGAHVISFHIHTDTIFPNN